MTKKRRAGASTWVDPDDAPELSDRYFERADVYEGTRLVRRGRPPVKSPKELVSIRYDRDVLDHFRATGPGWQRRMNEALRKVARLDTKRAQHARRARVQGAGAG
jgi:uncharacterized protein (DUF4415 family)